MSRNRIHSHSFTLVILALFIATMACTLVTEETVIDSERLVRPDRPSLILLAPANGNVYAAGTQVTLHALATDIESTISRIEFIIDLPGEELLLVHQSDNPEGESTLEAIVEWTAFGNQTYVVHIRAFRLNGDPNDPLDDIPSNEVLTSIQVIDPSDTGVQPDTPSVDETPEVNETEAPTESTDEPTIDLSTLPVVIANIDSVAAAPVRQGPGVTFDIINNLAQGTVIEVLGRSEDSLWFAIRLENGVAWVFSDVVDFSGNVDELPVISAPE